MTDAATPHRHSRPVRRAQFWPRARAANRRPGYPTAPAPSDWPKLGYDGPNRSAPDPASHLPAPVDSRSTIAGGRAFRALLPTARPPFIRDEGANRVDP